LYALLELQNALEEMQEPIMKNDFSKYEHNMKPQAAIINGKLASESLSSNSIVIQKSSVFFIVIFIVLLACLYIYLFPDWSGSIRRAVGVPKDVTHIV
jgi:hypothetical protein